MGLTEPPEKATVRPVLDVMKPLLLSTKSINSNVRVAIRIRPLNNQENIDVVSKHADAPVVVVDSRDTKVIRKQFEYDYVFDEDVEHDVLFGCVSPLIQSALAGYNATVFAYGQTGSGKTYTMGSDGSNDAGIIPSAVRHLFARTAALQKENDAYSVEMRVKFVEVYGEEVRDLLSPSLKKLTRASDCVSEEAIASVKECLLLLQKGMLSRKTAKTKMNATSSRSHAIFTVLLKQTLHPCGYPTRESYFNFVDLAGSERQKKTLAEGLRFKEGVDINKGLLALGNVINALSEGKSHIPYRDSKLTKMLQDSLGGNSATLMLACVSPARRNMSETLNSLEYAARARRICNKLVANQKDMADGAESPLLATEVSQLRHQVLMLKNERDMLLSRVAQLERSLDVPCLVLRPSESVEDETPEVVSTATLVAVAERRWSDPRLNFEYRWKDVIDSVLLVVCCVIVFGVDLISGNSI
ncbi:Aste57867_24492 [Aphanomyces stellatus]|uniref:Aste57867_24492 protein n=1 Tax=Aphanomyces stellatus TaxID=120398 RepID=A0A485LR96_9STRA|nr:hypothetical protein As57867_024415 [Aphanomyces stellatus]VFU01131.1 Aste57867_24492 [Aphanomyces stellatus]